MQYKNRVPGFICYFCVHQGAPDACPRCCPRCQPVGDVPTSVGVEQERHIEVARTLETLIGWRVWLPSVLDSQDTSRHYRSYQSSSNHGASQGSLRWRVRQAVVGRCSQRCSESGTNGSKTMMSFAVYRANPSLWFLPAGLDDGPTCINSADSAIKSIDQGHAAAAMSAGWAGEVPAEAGIAQAVPKAAASALQGRCPAAW